MDCIDLFKKAAAALQTDPRYLELDAARRGGYARVRIDGNMYDLDEEIKLEKNIKHTVEIVVDRLSINDTVRGRLADSIETAVALTGGLVIIDVIGGEPMEFSQNYACPEHGVSIDELSPRMFSFNNPFGACETCTGLGTFMKVDPARVIPDPRKSIRESAIKASGWYYAEGSISEMYYKALGKRYGFTLDTPIKEMSKEAVHAILYGTGTEKIEMQRENMFGSGTYMNTFEGIIPNLERRYKETRRQHPLAAAEKIPITEAIARERRLLQPLRDKAKYVIDTSLLSAAQNRERVCSLFLDKGESPMELMVVSFGFKYGLPQEADLVLDVRCLPNPFYVPELKHKTGMDSEVYDYVFSFPQTKTFIDKLEGMLSFLLPLYAEEGKSTLVIAVGCTGGHHRSVSVARCIASYLTALGYPAFENHRDITRG